MRVPFVILLSIASTACSSKKSAEVTSFEVTQITPSKIGLKRGYNEKEKYAEYQVKGRIRNLTHKTFTMYSLKLNYEVEGMNGEVFMIYKDYWPNFNDGFGGGIMVIGKRDPWEPSKEVEFDLDNTITQEWMKYPLKQVKAVCDLTVSDPTGYRDIHQLFVIDITNEWKQAQIEILD